MVFLCSSSSESGVWMVGVPYDGTASARPGARFGPSAIRQASRDLESYSPYLQKDLEDMKFYDSGDMPVSFSSPEKTQEEIYRFAADLFYQNRLPVVLGGEHSISIPVIRAAFEKWPHLRVVHIDAHCDLREQYGGQRNSHACVARRVLEFLPPEQYAGMGMRSGTKEEFAYAQKLPYFHPFDLKNASRLAGSIPTGTPVYITLDLDVLDPGFFPGTGTPEPGGVSVKELHSALILFRDHRIVGFDMVELAPPYDPSSCSCAAAAFFTRELVLMLQ
ncbi:MAG: agmatinase [Spirochaetota bacterium]